MPEMTSLAAIGTSIKVAFDLGKAIIEAKGQVDTAELRLRLAEILTALADAKMEMATAQDELRAKDTRIRDLQAALELREDVTRGPYDAYYRKGADGQPTGSPYCMACWERDHKLYHLAQRRGGGSVCMICKAVFDEDRSPRIGAPA